MALAADGGFVVTWQSLAQDGSSYGVYVRCYNQAGERQGGEFPVNSFTTGSQREPSVGLAADGDFVVAWTSAGQDGALDGVYARQYLVIPSVTLLAFKDPAEPTTPGAFRVLRTFYSPTRLPPVREPLRRGATTNRSQGPSRFPLVLPALTCPSRCSTTLSLTRARP